MKSKPRYEMLDFVIVNVVKLTDQWLDFQHRSDDFTTSIKIHPLDINVVIKSARRKNK